MRNIIRTKRLTLRLSPEEEKSIETLALVTGQTKTMAVVRAVAQAVATLAARQEEAGVGNGEKESN